jgi:starvation-inducible DNA-binding protein
MSISMIAREPKKSKAVAEKLVQALRETMVETAKAQTYHWNVTGMAFGPLHALFQEIYEDHFTAQDLIAERLKAMGEYADGRLAQALASSTIEEPKGKAKAIEMVRDLANDQLTLSHTLLAAARVAEQNDDLVTNDLAIERARVHDKFAWMLQAHLDD